MCLSQEPSDPVVPHGRAAGLEGEPCATKPVFGMGTGVAPPVWSPDVCEKDFFPAQAGTLVLCRSVFNEVGGAERHYGPFCDKMGTGGMRKTGNREQVTGDRDAETKNQNARGLLAAGRVDRMKPRSPPQISDQDGL